MNALTISIEYSNDVRVPTVTDDPYSFMLVLGTGCTVKPIPVEKLPLAFRLWQRGAILNHLSIILCRRPVGYNADVDRNTEDVQENEEPCYGVVRHHRFPVTTAHPQSSRSNDSETRYVHFSLIDYFSLTVFNSQATLIFV